MTVQLDMWRGEFGKRGVMPGHEMVGRLWVLGSDRTLGALETRALEHGSTVVALELLESGAWQGTGVLGPEAFPPDPFLELLADYGEPHGIVEGDPRRT